jgi:poly(ADP-ribose) glycohydrolase ARH3
MDLTADQFTGCVLGLATGDALGAPYEGGFLERLVWRFIGRTSDGCLRWTDDTQMALDLAASLLIEDGVRPDALANRFAASYRWSRGYGPGAARVLKRIRRGEPWQEASKAVYAEGSYGNGAAMRAPVLALFFARDRDGLIAAARSSARVTHAHPLGVEGAVLIALATHALLGGLPAAQVLDIVQAECSAPGIAERMKTVRSWIESEEISSPREVATKLGNGITAPTSCPTALYVALRHMKTSFEAMMEFIIACRGDVDTIGAMAGALWGVVNGAERLPKIRLEGRDVLVNAATRLFRRCLQSAGAEPDAAADGGGK